MKKEITIILIVIILALLGWWFWTSKSSQNIAEPIPQPAPQPVKEVERPKPAQRLTFKYQYGDGTHTLNGFMNVPNDCYDITHNETYQEETNSVSVALTMKQRAGCVSDAKANKPVLVSFDAPQGVHINATLNGAPVVLNLIRVSSQEEFEKETDHLKG